MSPPIGHVPGHPQLEHAFDETQAGHASRRAPPLPTGALPRGRSFAGAARRSPVLTTIVLAAGRSRRFGWANKLLADVGGRPLIAATLARVLTATRGPVMLIVDHQARALHAALVRHGVVSRRLHIVYVPGLRHDMSRSRASGVAAAPRLSSSLQIHLADVPGIDARTIDRLRRAIHAGAIAARPWYDGRPGHPVRFRVHDALAPNAYAHHDPQPWLKALPASAWGRIAGSYDCTRDIDKRQMLRNLICEHFA